ncbi:MAG TPA: fumarylacetoacetate hydrolase family protein [Thermoleophilaceae bacterium]|jgi:2-keto-4-pentenoate hydratase
MNDPRIDVGMRAQLEARARILSAGARPLGWKVGFNLPQIQERLGIDAPLAGFLTSAALIEDGATYALGGAPTVVEPEVAVEIGDDGQSIAALLPALEVADPPDLSLDVATILAGNIFHRAVAFGPRVETAAPGAARVLLNGQERDSVPADAAGANLEAMVEAITRRLVDAGETLRPGDRIITGVLAPPPEVEAGDRMRLELDSVGSVELAFS